MTPEQAVSRAIQVAVRAERWALARDLAALLAPPEPVRSEDHDGPAPMSAAERARAYRRRLRERDALRDADRHEERHERHVTRDVTERDASPSPSHTLPLPETTSQVQDSSSLLLPLGSLKQGSDLEERVTPERAKEGTEARRVTRKRAETDCPASDAAPDLVTQWCDAWAIPLPGANLEAAKFLDHHRARQSRFRDWGAAWRTWQRNAVTFARGRAPARSVQPVDMTAPWMRDGYGETLGKTGGDT